MSAEETLRQVEQQMLAARPWEAAEPESLWSISGIYPNAKGRFTDCLAMTLPQYATGSDRPVFMFCGGGLLLTNREPIDPALITHATPLLIVHRDEPTRAYWAEDQELLDGTR